MQSENSLVPFKVTLLIHLHFANAAHTETANVATVCIINGCIIITVCTSHADEAGYCFYWCLSMSLCSHNTTENLLIKNWHNLVGICYGAASKWLDFGDTWPWLVLERKLPKTWKLLVTSDAILQIYIFMYLFKIDVMHKVHVMK